jgi:hypothetical protein
MPARGSDLAGPWQRQECPSCSEGRPDAPAPPTPSMHRPRPSSLVRRRSGWLLLLAAVGLVPGPLAAQGLPSPWGSRPIDGGTWYEPADLPPGTVFNVWAPRPFRVEPAAGEAAFLQARRANGFHGVDMAGRSARCDEAETTPGGVTQACRLDDARGGPPLEARFVMLPLRQGRVHFIRVLTGGDLATVARLREGASAAMALETRRWAADVDTRTLRRTAGQAAAGPASGDGPVPGEAPVTAAPEEPAARRATTGRALEIHGVPPPENRPSAGHPPERADAAVLLFDPAPVRRGSHGAPAGGTVYLLLAGGTAYRGLAFPPEEVEVSKEEDADRWVAWRRRGAVHEVRNPGSRTWTRLDKAALARPAVEQERLGGRYVPLGGDSPGGSPSATALVFHPDGRFEAMGGRPLAAGSVTRPSGAVVTLSSSGQGASPRPGTVVSSMRPADGEPGNGPAPSPAGHDAVVSTSAHRPSPAGSGGTYRLDGWTLELRHGDGTVERRLFLFTDEAREGVRIGERTYRREGSPR